MSSIWDDLVLISESAICLQNSLNIQSCYCDKWNLTVNLDKTKSMIFNKAGRKLTRESFFYKNNRIDLGMEYTYLGIIFLNPLEFLQTLWNYYVKMLLSPYFV